MSIAWASKHCFSVVKHCFSVAEHSIELNCFELIWVNLPSIELVYFLICFQWLLIRIRISSFAFATSCSFVLVLCSEASVQTLATSLNGHNASPMLIPCHGEPRTASHGILSLNRQDCLTIRFSKTASNLHIHLFLVPSVRGQLIWLSARLIAADAHYRYTVF